MDHDEAIEDGQTAACNGEERKAPAQAEGNAACAWYRGYDSITLANGNARFTPSMRLRAGPAAPYR